MHRSDGVFSWPLVSLLVDYICVQNAVHLIMSHPILSLRNSDFLNAFWSIRSC